MSLHIKFLCETFATCWTSKCSPRRFRISTLTTGFVAFFVATILALVTASIIRMMAIIIIIIGRSNGSIGAQIIVIASANQLGGIVHE